MMQCFVIAFLLFNIVYAIVTNNKYTLSFSCTKFNQKGELEVLNRKYDALLVEILSNKDVVGVLKVDSKIDIEKVSNS